MKNKTDETINTYNNVVNEYIEYFNSIDLKGNVQFQKEIDVLTKELKEGSKILDVGTATGDYPKYLTEKCNKNFEVVGIDAAPNMIEIAKQKAPKAKFYVMDLRSLKFQQNYFDAIICLATLIHVNDDTAEKALKSFDHLLKPGGIMIVNVMEHICGDREIYGEEPFNPKYNTYFNTYKKEFFTDWFLKENYEILNIIDNKIFNTEKITEPTANTNQFSVIAKKSI